MKPVISFRCEQCHLEVFAKVVDLHVTCPACGHTVHAGVYVPESELRELVTRKGGKRL